MTDGSVPIAVRQFRLGGGDRAWTECKEEQFAIVAADPDFETRSLVLLPALQFAEQKLAGLVGGIDGLIERCDAVVGFYAGIAAKAGGGEHLYFQTKSEANEYFANELRQLKASIYRGGKSDAVSG